MYKIGLILLLSATFASTLHNKAFQRDAHQTSIFNKVNGRVFEEQLRELLEKFRELVINGDQNMGIPVLDPYERNYTMVNVTIPNTAIIGVDVYNGTLTGLKDFVIDVLKFSLLSMKLDFGFTIPALELIADHYDLSGQFIMVDQQKLFGNGTLRLKASDFKISGSAKISISNNHVMLKSFQIAFYIEDFVSEIDGIFGGGDICILFNQIVQQVVPGFLVRKEKEISQFLEPIIIKTANDILSNINISDIIG